MIFSECYQSLWEWLRLKSAFRRAIVTLGVTSIVSTFSVAETVIIPFPECNIRDAVAKSFQWYDSENQITASQRDSVVPYLTAEELISNPLATTMVRRLSDQFVEQNQINFDRGLLKQTFVDSCPPSDEVADLVDEFEFAFAPLSYAEKYIYGSVGSYLLNEKDRPDLAKHLLDTNYDLIPLHLWTNKPTLQGEDTEAHDSIFYQYQRYADRAKLAQLRGETEQIRKNAQDYLDLIALHKTYNQVDDAVTDLTVSYSLLQILQNMKMTELAGFILESEFAPYSIEKGYLQSIPISVSRIDKAEVYELLLRYHFEAVGQKNLAQAMQNESLILEMGLRELNIKSSKDRLLRLNAERLEFSEQHLPPQHTMILRDRFHDEIYKLLIKIVNTQLSIDELRGLSKQEFRAYISERERRIKERRMWVNPDSFPALENALSNWSEIFTSSPSMSQIDKDIRQKEIQYLQDWMNTNKAW